MHGDTLPNLSSPFFAARITAVLSSRTYSFVEVWALPDSGGGVGDLEYDEKVASGRYGSAVNPGVALDGATFAVGDLCLVRSADGAGGLAWELVPIGAGTGGAGALGCSSPAWLTALRPADCLRLTFSYDAPAGGSGGTESVTQTLDLTWDATAELWTSDTLLTICGETYTVTLDQDAEELTLTGELPEGGAAPFALTRRVSCGGCEYARFDFSKLRLCRCAPVAESTCDRLLSVRIERIDCGGTVVTCGDQTGVYGARKFAQFAGELAWLGCVDLDLQSARAMCDPDGVPIDGVTLLRADLLPLAPVGTFCSNVVSLSLQITGVGFATWQTLDQAFQLDPYLYAEDFLTPPAVLSGAGYTTGGASVAVSDDPCPATPPGYAGPGWYLTNQGELYLDGDSAELCTPIEIICGPYATQELLDAAIADGTCFPDDCTAIAGWGGAGWYCVESPGGSGPTCEPFELSADMRCDTTITICGGPYVDEAAATAACSGIEPPHAGFDCVDGNCVQVEGGPYLTRQACTDECGSTGCCGGGGSATVSASMTGNFGAGCVLRTATGTLTKGTGATWAGTLTGTGVTVTLSLVCTGVKWKYNASLSTGGTVSGTLTASGTDLTAAGTIAGGMCDGLAYGLTIAHPCPA